MPKLFENLWVKIAAILLAILLWFHVATEKVYQYEVTLPLTLVELSENLILVEPPPNSIKIIVEAGGKKLLRSDWRKSGLRLVVGGSRAAKFKTEISTGNLFLIKGEKVDLLDVILPREVILKCEHKLEKEVPVRSRVTVLSDDGYAIDDYDSIVPPTVTLIGPRNKIKYIKFIETEEKTIKGVRDDFRNRVALNYPDIYGLKILPDSVTMQVTVRPVKRQVFKKVPIRLINAPGGAKLSIDPASLELRIAGKAEAVDTISSGHISVIADYIMLDSSGMIPIRVVVPSTVSIIHMSADSVRLVEKK